jgi:hypothetical protein
MLGVALRLLGTVVAGRSIGRLLYEVPPNDPIVQHRRHLLRPWHPDRPDHGHTAMDDAEPPGQHTRGHRRRRDAAQISTLV